MRAVQEPPSPEQLLAGALARGPCWSPVFMLQELLVEDHFSAFKMGEYFLNMWKAFYEI